MKTPTTTIPYRAIGGVRSGPGKGRGGRKRVPGVETLEGRALLSHLLVTAVSGTTSYNVAETYLIGTPSEDTVNLNDTGGLVPWGDYTYKGTAAATAKTGSSAGDNSQLGDTIPGNVQGQEFALGAYSIAQLYSDTADAPWTATVTANASAKATLKIMPDAGQKVGDPVVVSVGYDPEDNGGATVTLTAGPVTHTGGISGNVITELGTDYIAKIGDTIPVSIVTSATNSGGSQGKASQVNGANSVFISIADSPVSTGTALNWDAKGASVDYSYTNSGNLTQTPTISFVWASGETINTQLTKAVGSVSGATAKGTYPGSLLGKNLTTPPAHAKYLLMVITVGQVQDVKPLAYNPSVTVSDKYGATAGEPANVLGRFFAGVPVVGEDLTITLSQELVVLNPGATGLVVSLGGHPLTLKPTSSISGFVTANFDPSRYNGSTPITVTDPRGGPGLAPIADKLDVIPLPSWFAAFADLSEEFDPTSKSYKFTGAFLNLKTGAFSGFAIPSAPGLWLGTGLETGVDAHATVTIVAPLQSGKAPTTENFQVGASLTILGSTSPISLPEKTISLDLDPRTLGFKLSTYTYSAMGSSSVPLLKGLKPFNQPPLEISTALTSTVTYTVNLTVAFQSNGDLDPNNSSLQFSIQAPFKGTLGIAGYTVGSAALDKALGNFITVIKNSNPAGVVKSAISEFFSYLATELGLDGILPSLTGGAAASGEIDLDGKVGLKGSADAAEPAHGTLTGQVNLMALPAKLDFTFLGQTYNLASLEIGEFLDLTKKINATF